jgi:hypothetical protein
MAGYRPGLEALLLLDESIFEQDGGFWVKIEARLVESQHGRSTWRSLQPDVA